MHKKHCLACGEEFLPWPQILNQQFCSRPECQKERRRRRQAERRAKSPEHQASDAQYFQDWVAKNPGYWKQYRETHPEYAERNRQQQKLRSSTRIAKDSVSRLTALPGGRYRLQALSLDSVANEAAWIVEILVLSGPMPGYCSDCKMKP
jgi:hypothetical protein